VANKNTSGPKVPDDLPDDEAVGNGVVSDESGFDLTAHILGMQETPEEVEARSPRLRRLRSRANDAVEDATEPQPVVDEAAKADAALKAAVAKADAGLKKASAKAAAVETKLDDAAEASDESTPAAPEKKSRAKQARAKAEAAKAEAEAKEAEPEAKEAEPETDDTEAEEAPVARKPRVKPVKVTKKSDAKKDEAEEDQSDEDETAEQDETDEDEDQPVRQASRKLTQAPVKKARPTRKRDEVTESVSKRTTPFMFIRQSVGELKKVVWPAGDVVGQYFLVVLVFVLVIMGFVFGLDQLFGWGLLKLMG